VSGKGLLRRGIYSKIREMTEQGEEVTKDISNRRNNVEISAQERA
jgi:hypothetical protein